METIECTRCLLHSGIVKIMPDGQCEYCKLHDKLESQSNPDDFGRQLKKVRASGLNKKYDCIMGISGGLDSSTLLFTAVRHWKLRPLVIHFDNHWNAPEAEHNMKRLVEVLNVDFIRYQVNKSEYDALNYAFLAAGVPDADIPNDIAMTKLMYQAASQYGIKYILNGHDFREEGSTPAAWTYMDAKYIQDVYTRYTGRTLQNYPLFTFWDQIRYGFLRGIKQIRPFHYDLDRESLEKEMREEIGFQWYGGKHCENVYTEFVGACLLPIKFGIDKRIVYMSARVRSGYITKDSAMEYMYEKPSFDMGKFPAGVQTVIEELVKSPIQPRTNFARYNFKRYRMLIWILAKMKVVPYTFYKKYCR